MADGNILNQPFGLNIKVPQRTIKQSQETAANAFGSIMEPILSFIDDNQSVFTGNVTEEINKYNLMMYNVGAAIRKGSTNGGFNVQG